MVSPPRNSTVHKFGTYGSDLDSDDGDDAPEADGRNQPGLQAFSRDAWDGGGSVGVRLLPAAQTM